MQFGKPLKKTPSLKPPVPPLKRQTVLSPSSLSSGSYLMSTLNQSQSLITQRGRKQQTHSQILKRYSSEESIDKQTTRGIGADVLSSNDDQKEYITKREVL